MAGADLGHDVLDALPDVTVVLRPLRDEAERTIDLEVLWCNAAGRAALGALSSGSLASTLWPWLDTELLARCRAVADGGGPDGGEVLLGDEGRPRGFGWQAVRSDSDLVVWVQRDAGDDLLHRHETAAAETRLRAALDQSFDGHAFFQLRPEGWVPAWVNSEYRRLDKDGKLTADLAPMASRVHETGRRISELVPIGGRAFEVRLYPVEHEVAVTVADQTEIFSTTAGLVWDVLHDPLTRIGNRSKLRQDLGTTLSRNGAATVLCLDLDGFKLVNDTMGHGAGDDVLREVAQRISAALRDGEEVYRLGGDEFVVIAGPLGQASASTVAQRIAARIVQPIPTRSGTATIDVSIGATVGTASEQSESIIARADAALYEAKRNSLTVVFA